MMSPNNHHTKAGLAIALAVAAIAPAPASARLNLNPISATPAPPSAAPVASSPLDLNRRLNLPAPGSQAPVQIIRVSAHSGFDWGDAGIGAAGGLGLSLLAIGGGLVVTRRGHRPNERSGGRAAAAN